MLQKKLMHEILFLLMLMFPISTIIQGLPFFSYINKALIDCEIKEYFDVVLSGHDFTRSKPDPEIYLTAMKKLGLDNDECLVIEDSPYGIKAGKNAGMFVGCRRDYNFGLDQSESDYIFDDLSGIFSFLN